MQLGGKRACRQSSPLFWGAREQAELRDRKIWIQVLGFVLQTNDLKNQLKEILLFEKPILEKWRSAINPILMLPLAIMLF